MNWKPYVTFAIISCLGHAAGTAALAQGEVLHSRGVTTFLVPSIEAQAGIDGGQVARTTQFQNVGIFIISFISVF